MSGSFEWRAAVVGISLLLIVGLAMAARQSVAFDGYRNIRIGQTQAELGHVLGRIVMPQEGEDQDCFYTQNDRSDRVAIMVLHGAVARLDVDVRGVEALLGAQVGDSILRIKQIYGRRLRIAPSFYYGRMNPYLTLPSADGRSLLRFETDHGRVSRYYIGRSDAVEMPEGCE